MLILDKKNDNSSRCWLTLGIVNFLTICINSIKSYSFWKFAKSTVPYKVAVYPLSNLSIIFSKLKRVSWINTSIGAIPGAIPPLGGWTAATNSLDLGGIALFLILFFWQHPHFYAIAFMYRDDYAKAGLKMLPVVDNGIKRTVLHIFLHALILIPISTLPFFFGVSGRVYFVGAYLLSNIYMLCCLPFILEQSRENASLIFKTSIYYFPLLFFLILADLFI